MGLLDDSASIISRKSHHSSSRHGKDKRHSRHSLSSRKSNKSRSRSRSRARSGSRSPGAKSIAASFFGLGDDDEHDRDRRRSSHYSRHNASRSSFFGLPNVSTRSFFGGGGMFFLSPDPFILIDHVRARACACVCVCVCAHARIYNQEIKSRLVVANPQPHRPSSGADKHRSSTSSYRRSPRPSFLTRAYKQLKRLLRDLVYYAKRHPVKVFTLIVLPLLTGGALTALLARFGLRLPPSIERMLGLGARAMGGDTVGLV